MNVVELFKELPQQESIKLSEVEAQIETLKGSIAAQERAIDALSQSPEAYSQQSARYEEMVAQMNELEVLREESEAELDALERIKELRTLLTTVIDPQASTSDKFASLMEARGHIDRIQKAGEEHAENSTLKQLYEKMPRFSLFLDQYQGDIEQAYKKAA